METPALPVQSPRIHTIDIVRGAIMVIMALDHVRDFYSNSAAINPMDLSQTTVALYLTRWITHLCAPTFVFLSGVSAYLSLSKKQSKGQAALFLLSRGVWLLFLELTIIGFGWQVDTGFHTIFAQVIWAIGWSMIFLAALVFLRPLYVGIIGLVIIFGHNSFDYIKADSLGQYKLLWLFVHEQGFYSFGNGRGIFMVYPLVPWVGVMAAGYGFGTLFKNPPTVRRSLFIKIGLACLVLFIILRGFNIYGDPFPWTVQDSLIKNIGAIFNVQKYPPSLAYLLITVGTVSMISLALLEGVDNRFTRILTVYGKVPMFYYILHIYLIHGSQIIIALSRGFTAKQLESFNIPGWGYSLPIVYLVWLSVAVILYFPCRWFMKVKQRNKSWYMSYI